MIRFTLSKTSNAPTFEGYEKINFLADQLIRPRNLSCDFFTMDEITTIKISKETKSRLSKLKEYDRETFDEVLKKILFILNTCRKDPEKSREILEKIDNMIKRKGSYDHKSEGKKDN